MNLWLIQILLESREDFANLFGLSQVGHGIGDGIVVFEPQQGRELILRQFFHPHLHVLRQHEIEKGLLPAVEVGADLHPGLLRPLLARERRKSIGDVSQHVEEVAIFGIDDPLHFGHLLVAKAFLREAL